VNLWLQRNNDHALDRTVIGYLASRNYYVCRATAEKQAILACSMVRLSTNGGFHRTASRGVPGSELIVHHDGMIDSDVQKLFFVFFRANGPRFIVKMSMRRQS
jgi:hypothetical protein